VDAVGGQWVEAGGAGFVLMLGAGSIAKQVEAMKARQRALYVCFMTVTV